MNYFDVIKPFLLSEVKRDFDLEIDNIFIKKQFDENYIQYIKHKVIEILKSENTFCRKMTYDSFINDFDNSLKLLIDYQIKPYYRANVEINENQKSEVVLDSSNNFLYLKSEISLYSTVRPELLPIIEYLKDLEVLHYINTIPSEQSVSIQDDNKVIPNKRGDKTLLALKYYYLRKAYPNTPGNETTIDNCNEIAKQNGYDSPNSGKKLYDEIKKYNNTTERVNGSKSVAKLEKVKEQLKNSPEAIPLIDKDIAAAKNNQRKK